MDWAAYLRAIEVALKTDCAFHIYAVLGGLFILAISARLAWREMKIVRGLSPNDFAHSFPGKEPWTCPGLEKRVAALKTFKKAKLWFAARHVGALAILGFIVPSVMLGVAVVNCFWLFDGHSPLETASGTLDHPTTVEAAVFVLSQFGRAISDALEIFNVPVGQVIIAHNQYVALTGILLYRLFVGTFTLATLFAIFFLVRVSMGTNNKIERLEKRRDDACKLGGSHL